MLSIDEWSISFEIAFRWLSQDFADHKATLVQVMAWCRQATSHYLSQCCPRSLSPYGVTRPQWVNTLRPKHNGSHFADIFLCISLIENFQILHKISLKYVPLALIDNKIWQHWFRKWLGAEHTTSRYLKKCRYAVLTYICVTRPRCVNERMLLYLHC